MFNFVRLSDGGIERIATVRSEVAVLADIGRRLLPDSPVDFNVFKRHQKVREAIARVVPGMEELADIDVAKRDFTIRGRLKHTPEFNMPEGKARFAVSPSTNEKSADYPFTLMTLRSEGQFNSIIYEEPDSYRGVDNRWTVMLNTQDALELGVSEGDRVDLKSEFGKMKAVLVKLFNLPRGSVAAYYPEANALASRRCDPRSHTPQFKSTPVQIVKTGVY
jgi:anaerobic selenocysteine-containing dehydrogenase